MQFAKYLVFEQFLTTELKQIIDVTPLPFLLYSSNTIGTLRKKLTGQVILIKFPSPEIIEVKVLTDSEWCNLVIFSWKIMLHPDARNYFGLDWSTMSGELLIMVASGRSSICHIWVTLFFLWGWDCSYDLPMCYHASLTFSKSSCHQLVIYLEHQTCW